MNDFNDPHSRREFLKQTLAVSSAGATLLSFPKVSAEPSRATHMRLGVVGTGNRLVDMWGPSVEKEYANQVKFVGLCDINGKRASYARTLFYSKPPVYTDFDKMVKETSPQTILITTVDATHVSYAVRAMELGCDVICEKPVATTAKDCQLLHDMEKRTGRKVTVTFNARYFVEATKIKELLLSGVLGNLYSIDYTELLDLGHGGDYFRRWHALKKNSGTLFCHKSSHQFDQVNWWVDSQPEEVYAYGSLKKFGRQGPFRSTHCRDCSHQHDCDFFWDITKSPRDMRLYVDNEGIDGYLRDACLFRKEIDIYDTMSLQCRYENGVLLNYSLNATSPIEGQIVAINGSKGRLEMRAHNRQLWEPANKIELRLVTNSPSRSKIIPLTTGEGGHAGADPALKNHIFHPTTHDPLGQRAGSRAGIYSSLIGIAGYISIESGKPVRINDLFQLT
jgi:predicted dehydrogenase